MLWSSSGECRTTSTHLEIITWCYRKLFYILSPPCKVSNPTKGKMYQVETIYLAIACERLAVHDHDVVITVITWAAFGWRSVGLFGTVHGVILSEKRKESFSKVLESSNNQTCPLPNMQRTRLATTQTVAYNLVTSSRELYSIVRNDFFWMSFGERLKVISHKIVESEKHFRPEAFSMHDETYNFVQQVFLF